MSRIASPTIDLPRSRGGRAPTILFNITHGFQARMLLRSKISETLLAQGVKLVVVSASSNEEYFRREFDHPQIALEDMPQRFSRVEAHLITLRQYLLMNPSLGATLNFKNEAFRRQAPKRYWIARTGNALLGRIPPLRKAYIAGEARLFGGGEFDSLLQRHRPDLIVTGTPGYNRNDIHLFRAAKRAEIPTATVMLSWDNLTSKGYMGGIPDHLLVWSDLMGQEAVAYHDYPRERIRWCGAAQFDHYHGLRDRLDRQAWRRQHGVPDGRPLIVYGTINHALLPHEVNIVRQIVDKIRGGAFKVKPFLWIRLHPQSIRGIYSDALEPYRHMSGEDVRVEEPRVQSDKLAWDLPKEDAAHLADLMAAADIVVTPCSTLSIDAACAGTPIINVFFDGPQPIAQELSSQRFMRYTHYALILETGGIAKAMNIDDFVRMTDAYVENPDLDREGREGILRQQLNVLDGNAGQRTAEALFELATAQHGKQPAH